MTAVSQRDVMRIETISVQGKDDFNEATWKRT